jgi:hypothetical protein
MNPLVKADCLEHSTSHGGAGVDDVERALFGELLSITVLSISCIGAHASRSAVFSK